MSESIPDVPGDNGRFFVLACVEAGWCKRGTATHVSQVFGTELKSAWDRFRVAHRLREAQLLSPSNLRAQQE